MKGIKDFVSGKLCTSPEQICRLAADELFVVSQFHQPAVNDAVETVGLVCTSKDMLDKIQRVLAEQAPVMNASMCSNPSRLRQL